MAKFLKVEALAAGQYLGRIGGQINSLASGMNKRESIRQKFVCRQLSPSRGLVGLPNVQSQTRKRVGTIRIGATGRVGNIRLKLDISLYNLVGLYALWFQPFVEWNVRLCHVIWCVLVPPTPGSPFSKAMNAGSNQKHVHAHEGF